jgi:hypothetical protein
MRCDIDSCDVPPRRPRPTFDPDYGAYLGALGDPRNPDEEDEPAPVSDDSEFTTDQPWAWIDQLRQRALRALLAIASALLFVFVLASAAGFFNR